ncbi:hypothetical protein HHI36_008671 [Cryptolaemus montrouzieri]|uniref:Uncharacterized protein n=1 Tax=Cryptolaemus montrouzieri TaxID=559131 RepID=A0ABD2MTP3_9CUCU
MAAEVLQLVPIVVQHLADCISESTFAGAVYSVLSLTSSIELERNIHIRPTTSEPATASLSQFDRLSTFKNLPSTQNFIQMSKTITVVKTRQGKEKQHVMII